jgi:uncharacterized membrane protein
VRTEPDFTHEQDSVTSPVLDLGLRSRMATRWLVLRQSPDLVTLAVIATTLPLLFILPVPAIRIPVGIVVVLMLPGFALIRALFPGRDQLSTMTLLGLSFGISIAVIPLLALTLHLTSTLIQPISITASLSLWILFWTGIAIWRRNVPEQHENVQRRRRLQTVRWRSLWDRPPSLTSVALVFGVITALVIVAVIITSINSQEAGTAFFVLGAEGEAQDYPRSIVPDELVTTKLGIANNEDQAQNFYVHVWSSELLATERGSTLLLAGPFRAEPGEEIEETMVWSLPESGNDRAVSFDLYRAGDEEPHRNLTLYVDVADQSSAGVRTAPD